MDSITQVSNDDGKTGTNSRSATVKEARCEIDHLEQIIIGLEQTVVNKDAELSQAKAENEQLQMQCENINQTLTAQKIELATLSEREKQQTVQLREKDMMLKQAEKLEQALNQQIAELTTKKHLINK